MNLLDHHPQPSASQKSYSNDFDKCFEERSELERHGCSYLNSKVTSVVLIYYLVVKLCDGPVIDVDAHAVEVEVLVLLPAAARPKSNILTHLRLLSQIKV